ncbi:hypothetical protein ACFOPS_04675 [Ralstonia solanacearum]|uniref:hypothetical protein n=1 Tax=Ralstonia solanacearum TaxID=305 RepID=UPI003623B72C
MGNTAESGKGGGLRLQLGQRHRTCSAAPVTEQVARRAGGQQHHRQTTFAGWAGGGVSLQDAVKVSFINNTVVSNDATASSGVLFNTDAAAQANVGPPNCTTVGAEDHVPADHHVDQPGRPVWKRRRIRPTSLPPYRRERGVPDRDAELHEDLQPILENNLFWQNRTFHITVGGLDTGIQGLQNIVTLIPT